MTEKERLALLVRAQASVEVAAETLGHAVRCYSLLQSREWTYRRLHDHHEDLKHTAASMFDELATLVLDDEPKGK